MKKVIIILLSFFLLLGYVQAKDEIFDFKCTYNMKNVNDFDLGKLEVIIYNYEDEGTKYTYEVYYENESGQMVKYTNNVENDYKNNNLNGSRGIGFFCSKSSCLHGIDKSEMEEFYKYYKEHGKCKSVYFSNVTADNTRVQTWVANQDDKVLLSATNIKFKGVDDNDWISEEVFKERNQDGDQTEKKEDLICNYKMRFDLTSNQSKVIIKRTYNKKNEPTYTIIINENEKVITSLDSTVNIEVGNYTNASVKIEPEDLKKIFAWEKCIDAKKIYHYLDSDTSNFRIHYITLDGKKAYKNANGGRVGDGTGGEPTTEIGKIASGETDDGTTPDLDVDIPEGNISSCYKLLGHNLSELIKAAINILQIVGAIICIVKGMMVLIPPILAKDADALKKAGSTLTKMAIILIIIFLLKPLLSFLGKLLDFDVTCFI